MRGSGDLIWGGGGGAPKAPPPIRGTFSTPDPKNGSQPHNSPRLRCYNIKRTQKLHAMCWNWQIFLSIRDCRDCKSEKSHSLTHSVTTWKQEMLAHLKTKMSSWTSILSYCGQQIFVLQHLSVVVFVFDFHIVTTYSHCYKDYVL